MKRIAFLLMTVALLVSAASCSKEDVIAITGHYRYDGNLEEVLDARDFYDFIITENTMTVNGMWSKDDVKTFNYTRKVNRIKITPALGGKVSEAKIVETSDGFGLRLDGDRALFFTERFDK